MARKYRLVSLFWAAMDGLYIAGYLGHHISQKRIPFIDDVLSFSELWAQHGGGYWLLVMFVLSMMLTLSTGATAALFLCSPDKAWPVALAQTPLRLLLVVPSLSFLPGLLQGINSSGAGVALTLLVLSEAIKVGSLLYMKLRRGDLFYKDDK